MTQEEISQLYELDQRTVSNITVSFTQVARALLRPRLEEWIIAASGESNIRLNRYNLPHNPEQLHAIINIKTDQFQRLVKELMQSSQRVGALRNLLRERTRRSH